MQVKDVTEERGKTYGSFMLNANVAQQLKKVVHAYLKTNPRFKELDTGEQHTVKEGLDMICSKMSRIATGDPLHMDNFVDIAGYASIVMEQLKDD